MNKAPLAAVVLLACTAHAGDTPQKMIVATKVAIVCADWRDAEKALEFLRLEDFEAHWRLGHEKGTYCSYAEKGSIWFGSPTNNPEILKVRAPGNPHYRYALSGDFVRLSP
jgi:hypothetical protein